MLGTAPESTTPASITKRRSSFSPTYAEAINNLGTVFFAKKSYRRAIEQYRKALRLHPDSSSILSNLGTAYFARKNYDEAANAYQEAVAIDPEVFDKHSSQGTLVQDQSVEERAKYHYYLAKTFAKAGTRDRALQYIRKALEEGFKDREKFLKDPNSLCSRTTANSSRLWRRSPRSSEIPRLFRSQRVVALFSRRLVPGRPRSR